VSGGITAISRVDVIAWLGLLLLVISCALVLAPRPGEKHRIDARWFVRALAATGLAAFVLIYRGDLLIQTLPGRVRDPTGLIVTAGVVVTGVALADFILGRALTVATGVMRLARLPEPAVHWAALVVTLAVAVVASGIGFVVAVNVTAPGEGGPPPAAAILASHRLPGSVMDVVFRGELDGFASLGEGLIVHFRLPVTPDGRLHVTTVADGLEYPRGLAIASDVLFVAELGPLPCEPAFPLCWGANVDTSSATAGEAQILESSRGRILAFDIEGDGSLTGKRSVLEGLPFANTLHGVNGVVAGPDGFLYVTIGSLDLLWSRPGILQMLRRPHADLLGTVIRLAADGSDVEVFASGLRNVYGLTFDQNGELYGVDNSGPTVRGWRGEELLHIKEGADYGYPRAGSYSSLRTDPPLWLLDSRGSAAIAPTPSSGSPGLLIGSCEGLERIALAGRGPDRFVAGPGNESFLLHLPGCITAIEPGPNDTIVLGVFALPDHPELGAVVQGQPPNLYLVDVAE
jgi:hypothetical protein